VNAILQYRITEELLLLFDYLYHLCIADVICPPSGHFFLSPNPRLLLLLLSIRLISSLSPFYDERSQQTPSSRLIPGDIATSSLARFAH